MSEPVFLSVPGVPQSAHPHRELAIAELFSRQKTIATLGQLEELGLSGRGVRRRAEIGRLHRIYLGVYSTTPPALLPPRGHWLAAVLGCGPDAYLSLERNATLRGAPVVRSVLDEYQRDEVRLSTLTESELEEVLPRALRRRRVPAPRGPAVPHASRR